MGRERENDRQKEKKTEVEIYIRLSGIDGRRFSNGAIYRTRNVAKKSRKHDRDTSMRCGTIQLVGTHCVTTCTASTMENILGPFWKFTVFLFPSLSLSLFFSIHLVKCSFWCLAFTKAISDSHKKTINTEENIRRWTFTHRRNSHWRFSIKCYRFVFGFHFRLFYSPKEHITTIFIWLAIITQKFCRRKRYMNA